MTIRAANHFCSDRLEMIKQNGRRSLATNLCESQMLRVIWSNLGLGSVFEKQFRSKQVHCLEFHIIWKQARILIEMIVESKNIICYMLVSFLFSVCMTAANVVT